MYLQRLCGVYKPGGMALSQEQLEFCLKESKDILKSLHKLLDAQLSPKQ